MILPERYLSPTWLSAEPDDPLDGETQAIENVLEATDWLVHFVGRKRALALLNEALGALARVEAGGLIPEKTAAYREEAFAIRAAMLEALEAARRGDLPGSV